MSPFSASSPVLMASAMRARCSHSGWSCRVSRGSPMAARASRLTARRAGCSASPKKPGSRMARRKRGVCKRPMAALTLSGRSGVAKMASKIIESVSSAMPAELPSGRSRSFDLMACSGASLAMAVLGVVWRDSSAFNRSIRWLSITTAEALRTALPAGAPAFPANEIAVDASFWNGVPPDCWPMA